MTKTNLKQKQEFVSYAVLAATLAVVITSLVSLIFPALIVRTVSSFPDRAINPFEVGAWAGPFFATNFILLAIAVTYRKKILPTAIMRAIKFILDFEISRKTSLIVFLTLMGIFVSLTVGQLATEEEWGDYPAYKQSAQSWSFDSITKGFDVHIKLFLLSSSLKLFNNIRVMPFLVTMSLLVLTYFITVEIARKRFAGIISMIILIQSDLFLTYSSAASYDNSWTLLYLLSLYAILKKWFVSPISYFLSIFSKPLTLAFLPITFFFIARSSLPRKKKIITFAIYAALVAILIIIVFFLKMNLVGAAVYFDSSKFWEGFASWAFQLHSEGLVLLFILPLTIGLFMVSRKHVTHTDSVMVMILVTLLIPPFLEGFTEQTIEPYRFIPLIVFFAMGSGIAISRLSSRSNDC